MDALFYILAPLSFIAALGAFGNGNPLFSALLFLISAIFLCAGAITSAIRNLEGTVVSAFNRDIE
jgi:hypothetical protein